MIKRSFRKVIALSLVAVGLFCFGCAGTEVAKEYRLSQPSDFWCSGGSSSPFPPYCHPDHW